MVQCESVGGTFSLFTKCQEGKSSLHVILQLLSPSWGEAFVPIFLASHCWHSLTAEGSRSSGGSVSLMLGRVFPPRTKFSFK